MELKYKNKIKEYKKNNNNLIKENNKLKKTLQQYNISYMTNPSKNNNLRNMYASSTYKKNKFSNNNIINIDDYLNKTMFYNYDVNNALNNDNQFSENQYLLNDNLTTYRNNHINPIKNLRKTSYMTYKNSFIDDNQNKNNKMINEFKNLLNKIDEKLDSDKK